MPTPEEPFTLTCAQGAAGEVAARELATAQQLLGLLRRYDLARWRFTSTIRIEGGVIPHSHPTLTLNTRHWNDDTLLLSTYLHEQLHHFLDGRQEGVERAVAALRARYPQPPVGYPQGARDEYSSYAHYLICWLEWLALVEVVGANEATRAFTFWRGDHYRAIYATVMDDGEAIGAIVAREVGQP